MSSPPKKAVQLSPDAEREKTAHTPGAVNNSRHDPFKEDPFRDGRGRGPYRIDNSGLLAEHAQPSGQVPPPMNRSQPSDRAPPPMNRSQPSDRAPPPMRHSQPNSDPHQPTRNSTQEQQQRGEGFIDQALHWVGLEWASGPEEQRLSERQVDLLGQLIALGFPEQHALEAVRRTSSIEAAVEWILRNKS